MTWMTEFINLLNIHCSVPPVLLIPPLPWGRWSDCNWYPSWWSGSLPLWSRIWGQGSRGCNLFELHPTQMEYLRAPVCGWVACVPQSVIYVFIYSGFKTPPFIALCIIIHMCFCILKLYLVEDGLEMLPLAASSLQPSPLQITIAAEATWAVIGCWKPRKATGSTFILRGWLLMKTMTSKSSCLAHSCIKLLILYLYQCWRSHFETTYDSK